MIGDQFGVEFMSQTNSHRMSVRPTVVRHAAGAKLTHDSKKRERIEKKKNEKDGRIFEIHVVTISCMG